MRTIDADALRGAVESHVTSVSVCATAEQARGRTDFKKLCLKDIDEAPTVGGWISVEDRLPEIGKVVLAFGTGSATTGMFQGISVRNDLWLWYRKGNIIKHVSHWMPLPEPPREVKLECD